MEKLYSCFKCKEKKTASNFSTDRSRYNGLTSKCKKCHEKYRTHSPDRHRKLYKRHRERHLKYQKNYRERFPEKVRAKIMVSKALKEGIIIKEPCVECGSKKSTGHHPDYSKPLEVIWLCMKHHQILHRELLLKATPPLEEK